MESYTSMDNSSSEVPRVIPFHLLKEITDGFSNERTIGKGAHGQVFMGVHKDGEKIAVKMLYDMPGFEEEQFQNEFNNLVRLQHKNIVRFVSYCYETQKKLVKCNGKLVLAEKIYRLLCFEYMQNGSLGNYLSDEHHGLDWHTRYAIIKGICMGLKYLHEELEPPIYHLDLKPGNVLLDENMVPKLADFGLSRLFGEEETRITKSSIGTHGYLPPEYIESNVISKKFDIFSLGVVIIKIMTGPTGYSKSYEMPHQQFIEMVHENWRNRIQETQMCMLEPSCEQVKRCIEIALRCLESDRRKRPSIGDIVHNLNDTETEQEHKLPNVPTSHKKRKERIQSISGNDVNRHALVAEDNDNGKHVRRMRTSENSSLPRDAAPTSAIGSRCSGGSAEEGGSECSSPATFVSGKNISFIRREVFKLLVRDGYDEEFRKQIDAHFERLPLSYQEQCFKAEDVLIHQKVLAEAKNPDRRPAFFVRFVKMLEGIDMDETPDFDARQEEDVGVTLSTRPGTTLQQHIHEIIFSTVENRNNLKQMSRLLLEDIGLQIKEGHAFSTVDGYAIFFFVVIGWQGTNGLHNALEEWISVNKEMEEGSWCGSTLQKLLPFQEGTSSRNCSNFYVSDIDIKHLQIVKAVASRYCGDMFLGTYFGEDVAINIPNSKKWNPNLWDDFKQEIYKLREVDHANIVRLVGSVTKPPCIITEWISGGNLFDFLHSKHNVLDLPMITEFALDVCRGMSYLHQKGIIHGDLKSANLLMDTNHVVKVANFGLPRFVDEDMRAETATYRWMAPEVIINNQAYDTKADVYSFAILLYELMTSKIPYDNMTPLQAAAAVIEGMRLQLPADAHPGLANLVQKCWDAVPSARPSFSDIITELEDIQVHTQGTSRSWEDYYSTRSQLLPNESHSGSEHATFFTAASENTTFFTAMTGSISGDEPETEGLPRQ